MATKGILHKAVFNGVKFYIDEIERKVDPSNLEDRLLKFHRRRMGPQLTELVRSEVHSWCKDNLINYEEYFNSLKVVTYKTSISIHQIKKVDPIYINQ